MKNRNDTLFIAMLFYATSPHTTIDVVKEANLMACRAMIDSQSVSEDLYKDINGVLSLTSKGKRIGFTQVEVIYSATIEYSIYNSPMAMIKWLLEGNLTIDERHEMLSFVIDFIIDNEEFVQHSEAQQRMLFDAFKLLYVYSSSVSYKKMMGMSTPDHKFVFVNGLLSDIAERNEPFNVVRKKDALILLDKINGVAEVQTTEPAEEK